MRITVDGAAYDYAPTVRAGVASFVRQSGTRARPAETRTKMEKDGAAVLCRHRRPNTKNP